MIIAVCADKNKGMMFNHRRQSQDKVLREKFLKDCRGLKIWMNRYSYKIFEDFEEQNKGSISIAVDENFLEKAQPGEVCFVEDQSLQCFEHLIETAVVFWWDKIYPADFYLDLDFNKWERIELEEFEGSSHEKIMKEVYRKNLT